MESVHLTFEQLALIVLLSMAAGALLLNIFRSREDRRESSREVELLKAAAFEAEARARRDRAAVDEWIQKR